MTPDPLPVALPELPTVALLNASDLRELAVANGMNIWAESPAIWEQDGYNPPVPAVLVEVVRKSDAEAALRAQAEEVAALRADAERLDFLERAWFFKSSEGYIEFAFNECWDAGRHDNLRAAIDAHLAASKQEKPHG